MLMHKVVRRGLRRARRVALGAVASAVAFGCGPPASVPRELLGIWKTQESRHADAFLEVRPASLMLGVGRQELQVLDFGELEIARDRQGNDVLRFHYPGESGDEVFVLTRLRGKRALRVGGGEGTWYPSRTR